VAGQGTGGPPRSRAREWGQRDGALRHRGCSRSHSCPTADMVVSKWCHPPTPGHACGCTIPASEASPMFCTPPPLPPTHPPTTTLRSATAPRCTTCTTPVTMPSRACMRLWARTTSCRPGSGSCATKSRQVRRMEGSAHVPTWASWCNRAPVGGYLALTRPPPSCPYHGAMGS
jgi:hypothetical protein